MHGLVNSPGNHHSFCFAFQRPSFRSPSLQWIVTRHTPRTCCKRSNRVETVVTAEAKDDSSPSDFKSRTGGAKSTGSKVTQPLRGLTKPTPKRMAGFRPTVKRKRKPPIREQNQRGAVEVESSGPLKNGLGKPPPRMDAVRRKAPGSISTSSQEVETLPSKNRQSPGKIPKQPTTPKASTSDPDSMPPQSKPPQPNAPPRSQPSRFGKKEVEERARSLPDEPLATPVKPPVERQEGKKKVPSMVEGGVSLGDLSQYRQSAFEFVEEKQGADPKGSQTASRSTSGPSASSQGVPPGFDPNNPKIPDFDMSDLDLSKIDQQEVKEVLDEMMNEGYEGEEAEDFFSKDNYFASQEELDRRSNAFDADFPQNLAEEEPAPPQETSEMSDMPEEDDSQGFNMDELFGTESLDDILEKLNAATEEEGEEEGESGAKPSEKAENIEDGDPNVQPEIDLTFTDDEARMFVEKMKNVDLNDLLEGKKNLIGEFEDTIGKSLKAPGFEDELFENPFERLVWEIAHYLYPRKGKKTNRQNWAHMNVSEEVKEKRRRKKSKGFAIWLSMEITKAANDATGQLRKVQHGSEDAKSIVEKCMQMFMGFLNGHTSKLALRHFCALIQRFALVASRGGLQEWILMVYPSLFVTLIAGVRSRVEELDARQVSELVWAFGKLGPKVFDVEGQVMELDILPDRSEVNVGGFYGDVMKRATEIAEDFGPRDVANFAYGVSIMPERFQNVGSVGILIDASAEKAEEFNAQDMSNLCWSMVKLGIEDRSGIIGKLVRHAETKVPTFRCQGYSMLVKSLGHMDREDCESLLTRIVNELKYRDGLKKFKPKELANFAWGLAKLRYYPSAWFFAAVEDDCLAKLDQFNGSTTCVVLLAFATWGSDSPRLTSACKAKLLFTTDRLTSRDVVNSAWSFAMLGLLDEEYLSFCVEQLNGMNCEDMKAQELRQLRQCAMDAAIFSPQSKAMDKLSKELVNASKAAWEEGQLSYETPSEVQEALELLSSSGLKCESRTWLKDKAFLSSVVEFAPGVDCLIEMKVPGCKFQNQPNLSIGKVRWREKVLASMGYFVLQLDPTVWNSLTTDEEKLQYLKSKI
ncbi:hypothetical protein BSKO_10027 [Bryopsis sp. KO-2023]|nr:hypothetical protein BSKO_10027 [Bryopsis sp. KO-2023]